MVYSDPEKLIGRPLFDIFSIFSFFGRIFATTRLSDGNEQVFRNSTSQNDSKTVHVPRFVFAAANAAATTRLSDGNEQVFRNFTPENMAWFLQYL